jgi:hypothetical protein
MDWLNTMQDRRGRGLDPGESATGTSALRASAPEGKPLVFPGQVRAWEVLWGLLLAPSDTDCVSDRQEILRE